MDTKAGLWKLNPDAGVHAIPDEPRELAAALAAGEESLRRCPYYEARYGERGQRFTRSDSAWLATLPDMPIEALHERVGWLGRILSSRGMPRLLLEQHLVLLAERLSQAVPERAASYGRLTLAAGRLAEQRAVHAPDALLDECAGRFDALADPAWCALLPRTGELLAAAVADHEHGIDRALTSLVEWLGDRRRFPPAWVEAVGHTMTYARAAARRRPLP